MTNYLKKMGDSEILENLNEMGLNITIQGFKEEASKAGSPSALVEQWLSLHEVNSIDEGEFLYEAAIYRTLEKTS